MSIKIYKYPHNTYKIQLKGHHEKCNLHVEFIKLYKYPVSVIQYNKLYKDKDAEIFEVEKIEELFEILCKNKKATFNYCFKGDGKLYLCKTTDTQSFKKCKHMYLCRKFRELHGKTGICAAGTIQFDCEKKLIYIDDQSGSYRPELKDIHKLKESIETSFPSNPINILLNHTIKDNFKELYCHHLGKEGDLHHKYCGGKRRTRKNNRKLST